MNLAELRELSTELSIACPNEERSRSVQGVAEALDTLRQIASCRSLVVTMGGVGMVVYDPTKRVIAHLGLTKEGRSKVVSYLRAENVCGMGDETFAALVAAYELFRGDETQRSRLIHAARQAWADVLRAKSPFLNPTDRWFQVRLFPFGALMDRDFPAPSTASALLGAGRLEQAL